MIRKLRAGHDAAAGRAASRRRPRSRRWSRALETAMDTAAALAPEPGLASVPAPEPRRVRRRGARPARPRRRRQRVPAGRHDQRRLRQRRRRAELLAAADAGLSARGQPDQPAGRRRPQRERHLGHLQDRAQPLADGAGPTARRSARAAARRWSTSSRPTATTCIKTAMVYAALGGLFGRTPLLAMGFKEQVDVSVNGERVALLDVSPAMTETDFGQNKGQNGMELRTPPIHIKAGPHRISAAFIQRLDGPVDDLMAPIENTAEGGDGYGIDDAAAHARHDHPRADERHRRVRDGEPAPRLHLPARPRRLEEEACADRRSSRTSSRARTAARARRRASSDAMQFYAQGRKSGDFENGIRMALQSILVSPQFLFRLEGAAPAAAARRAPTASPIDDLAVAAVVLPVGHRARRRARSTAAGAGRLQTRAGAREAGAAACSPTARSEALSTRFASQWLRLQDLDKLQPEFTAYPQFDETLRDAMRRETAAVLRQHRARGSQRARPADGRLQLRQRAAGPPLRHRRTSTAAAFRRVTLPRLSPRAARPGQHPDAHVGGRPHLAGAARQVGDGSAARHAAAAAAARRAGARRVGEGHRPAASACRRGSAWKSIARARACTSCHRVIDPLGLALDNFDVTGAWRIKDNEVPVDSVGDLYDGTQMDGPAGLRDALLRPLRHGAAQLHREPDDLRARPAARVHRHAGGARHRQRRREARQPPVGVRARRRQQRGVPHERRRTRPTSRHDRRRALRSDERSGHDGSQGDAGHVHHAASTCPRRTALKGMGVTLALPFLDAMAPVAARAQARARPPRRRCGWSPSRWCTARPAARRSASRRTCGRRPASGATSTWRRRA